MGLKISDMIIGLLIVGLVMSVFVLIATNLSSKYAATDPSGQLAGYQTTLAPLKANVDEIKAKQDNVSSSSKLDVIGDYFNQGYSALKITGNSFAVMNNISNQALQDVPLGPTASIFQSYITVIIIVIIFIAILLTILVRAEI